MALLVSNIEILDKMRQNGYCWCFRKENNQCKLLRYYIYEEFFYQSTIILQIYL